MDLIEIQEAITSDLGDINNFYDLIKLSLKYIEYNYQKNFKIRRPCNFQIISVICENLYHHYDNKDNTFHIDKIIKNSKVVDNFIENNSWEIEEIEQLILEISPKYTYIEDNMIKMLTVVKKNLDNNLIIYSNRFETSNAIEKIKEAIYIIENCFEIDDKIKKTIIRNLEKTIKALENKKYTRFYGHIKETLTILAAFGSIASGVAGVQQIKETVFDPASEVLNECITIVEQEIIHINIENEQYFIQPKTLNKLLTGQKEIEKMNAELEEQ
ncbi:MAG: hypothetical protein AB4060_17825 [Crocosphaera sp.]